MCKDKQEDQDIKVDQQSEKKRASPATIPQRLMLRAKTSRKIGTTLVTDSNMKVGEDSWTNSWCYLTVTSGHHGLGTSGFGSLGGIQARSLLSSSTFHQRIMSVGREPLVEEGS